MEQMDEELRSFIREYKARVAEDKASLDQDPPYMEMRSNVRRAQGSAVKENIPPACRTTVQVKEEGICVGLPLGVEYAKKKQGLQQELRMDFRRYMAEKNRLDTGQSRDCEARSAKEHLVPHPPSLSQGPRLPSHTQRGAASSAGGGGAAAMPSEGRRPTLRANPPLRRRRASHREGSDAGPLERGSGNEEEEEDDGGGEPVEGRQQPQQSVMGVPAAAGSSSWYRAMGENREPVAGGARIERRSRLTNRDQTEFATGLLIGAADAEEALRKRQERYRQELEEQIADQQRRKRREKELELRVAAAAPEPDKQLDHIKYMGLTRWREGAARETYTGRPPRENPLPEPGRTAFQSPLLEYSAALGEGLLSPYCQPGPPPLHRALRLPSYLPHPPAAPPEAAYRGLCQDASHYHGNGTAVEPHPSHLPYCGPQLPGTSGGFPASYWAVPPGGSTTQLGHQSQHGHYAESHVSDPPHPPPPPPAAVAATRSPRRAAGGAASVDSLAGPFPGDRARSTKDKMNSYKEALAQQILERQERRRVEQEERERDEARLEADMRNHQPWGRGGGGAPLRDSTGNLLTDLHQMHKLNEEAYIRPEQRARRAPPAAPAALPLADQPAASDRVSGFARVQTPTFARGNVFANEPSAQQVHEQDKYKVYLKEQIEAKRRQKAEEQEQSRLEEEREERKLAEQRARIQREFEEEQGRRTRKETEQKRKNEELVRLAEERKREAERAEQAAEEKETAELRQQYERERQARLEEQVHREPSPPIPTLQRRQGTPPRYTPRPPTFDSQRSTAPMSERSLSGLQSPPVPACKNHLRATEDKRDVFSELSALRRQLRSEQRRLEDGLLQGDWEERASPMRDRLRERPPVDVFDMARLRLQAAVRRPLSRNPEPGNLQRIHDSLQLQPSESEFRALSTGFPRVREGDRGVASQRRRSYRDHPPMSGSQRSAQDGHLDGNPPQHRLYQRGTTAGSARGSLLDSDSSFIDPLGDAYPVPPTPEQRETPQLSARERRRLTRKPQSPPPASRDPVGRPISYSRQSQSSVHGMDPGGRRVQNQTGRPTHSRHDNQTGRGDRPSPSPSFSSEDEEADYGEEEEGSSPPRHPTSSWDSVATDLWAQPQVKDALRRITNHRLLRRELPAAHGSAH
ncbi:centrosome and spindle pole associated protein 1-like isoform X4 [Gadus macrocephalus]|uniref:centrosome and spindle pole associated protein 1-like isoform X4 n=1 Tax=Gadus macrocephalus TaxID=80720 RepID=UPI0028CB6CFA|nr:centrosome and spindle pole associated protein 1-like isoform X4 [Gadus macrocephalus]